MYSVFFLGNLSYEPFNCDFFRLMIFCFHIKFSRTVKLKLLENSK